MISSTASVSATGQVIQLVSGTNKPATLPRQGSVVLVQVLERAGANSRLLIDGSVFQAQLPMNLTKGEEFLARVVKQQPFTLQTDLAFVHHGPAASLLKKLGITGKWAEEVLQEFVSRKKPIIKSRIEWIIDKLDNSNHPDPLQMQLAIGLSMIPIENLEEKAASIRTAMKRSLQQIITEIFQFTAECMSGTGASPIVKETLEAVLIEPFEGEATHDYRIIDLAFRLDSLKKEVVGPGYSNIAPFITNLAEYIIQKALYNFFSVFPSFSIIRGEKGLELQIFNHYLLENGNFSINCDIFSGNPEPEIRVRGAYNHPSVHLQCIGAVTAPRAQILQNSLKFADFQGLQAYWSFPTSVSGRLIPSPAINRLA